MPGTPRLEPDASEPRVYIVRVWCDCGCEVHGFVRDLQQETTRLFARRTELLQLLAPLADPEPDQGELR